MYQYSMHFLKNLDTKQGLQEPLTVNRSIGQGCSRHIQGSIGFAVGFSQQMGGGYDQNI